MLRGGAHPHLGPGVQCTDKYIINVSAMEGKFYRHKSPFHPHTNAAKAGTELIIAHGGGLRWGPIGAPLVRVAVRVRMDGSSRSLPLSVLLLVLVVIVLCCLVLPCLQPSTC